MDALIADQPGATRTFFDRDERYPPVPQPRDCGLQVVLVADPEGFLFVRQKDVGQSERLASVEFQRSSGSQLVSSEVLRPSARARRKMAGMAGRRPVCRKKLP